MALAAALGMDNDETLTQQSVPSTMSNRLQNKLKHGHHSNHVIGEINRSIEKMSLNGCNTGAIPKTSSAINVPEATRLGHQQGQNAQSNVNRRGSNWTNSTEGYGSLTSSDQSMLSRRCSDLSAMSQGSNFSTRAVRNSNWDQGTISACSSRRSSLLADQNGHNVSQQLDRLHQKAVNTIQSPVPPTQQSLGGQTITQDMFDCQSVMSDCSMPTSNMGHSDANNGGQFTQRRASDPVRTLDRNFGVGGQMSRHRSYTHLNNAVGQQQRLPLHGQNVRGMSNNMTMHMNGVRK